MVLALADFDTVGLDVLLSALITAGNNAQAGGTAIYVSGVGTPGGWGTHGTLDDGSLEYVSGSSISRLLYVTGSSTMRFNDNPDPAHIYDFFDSGDGAGTTCYLQTEADGVTSFDIDDGIYRVDGSNWINLLPGAAFFTMLSGLGAGDVFIMAIAAPAAPEEASFSATAGDPTATFVVTFTAPADSDASFEATAGDPTATFTPEDVVPSDASFAARAGDPEATFTPKAIVPANASFAARAGDPTATFVVTFSHTSSVSFAARAGDPTAVFTPTFVAVSDSDASFAVRAGNPTATFGLEASVITDASFEARAGNPTATFTAETHVRVIPPGSWEKLESIIRENRRSQEWEAAQPPESCPHDGSRLAVRGGIRDCPMGNYRWVG